jgi:hypothetical protein
LLGSFFPLSTEERGKSANHPLYLTGAAILVSRKIKFLQRPRQGAVSFDGVEVAWIKKLTPPNPFGN